MFKKIFYGKIDSIALAAFLVAVSSLASRLLGVVRDRVLAGQFGAGDTLDVYYAAFRVPDLIFNLVVLGALSAGFIPIFTGLIRDQEKTGRNQEAWKLASQILNTLIIGVIVLCALGMVFAAPLMSWITPGFNPEKMALTVQLTRIMFLSPLLLGISSVLGGILQSFKRFFFYSLSPIFYNLGIIFGAIYLVPTMGVYGLAWGIVIGAGLHCASQLPAIFSLGFRWQMVLGWRDKLAKKVWGMMVARTMSLVISQANLIVITVIASTLPSGSLSVFNLANNLQAFPVSIFGISFAVAVFPTLSAYAFDKPKLVEYYSRTLRQIFFFIIPSTVIMLALRAQIIRVVLGYGQFDWQDTVLTLNTLGMFTISFFAQAALPLQVRVFYARHNSAMPFYLGLVCVIVERILAWAFAPTMGVAGLGLAFSLASILNFILLTIFLRIDIGAMDGWRIVKSTAKLIVAAVIAGLAIQGMKEFIWPFTDMTKVWGVVLQGGAAGIFGSVIYLAVCALLKSEEFAEIWNIFKARILGKKGTTKTEGIDEVRGV